MYIHHFVNNSKVLGPGNRFIVWVQGCNKRCYNCFTPDAQSINQNGFEMSIENLYNLIINSKNINGITISGGEPFLQSEELKELIEKIKQTTKLDIMIYTGFTINELINKNQKSIDFILSNIDILIDGEYVDSLNNNSIFRGSDNQKFHFLSDKYKKYENVLYGTQNRDFEIVLKDELFIVGIPPKNFNNNLSNLEQFLVKEENERS